MLPNALHETGSQIAKALRFITTVSRPRFAIYLAGPYILGRASADPFFYRDPLFYSAFLFFLLPANFFLYGINDYYDTDTDRFNPKKQTKEHLLASDERALTKNLLIGTAVLYAGAAMLFQSILSTLLLFALLGLSWAYSSPPLRFKKYPFIDSASNALYIIPGLIGYSQISGHLPPWNIIMAGMLWAAAMHLFSAIPDIASDRAATLTTTAVYLGKRHALFACSILWTLSFFAALPELSALVPWSIPLIVYPLLPLYVVMHEHAAERVYWWFPSINMLSGALLFWGAFFQLH